MTDLIASSINVLITNWLVSNSAFGGMTGTLSVEISTTCIPMKAHLLGLFLFCL